MPVIPKKGGPYSLFCTDCGVWTSNTANAEMRKEGFYAHSHICGHFDALFEVRDTDWQKKRKQEDKIIYEELVTALRFCVDKNKRCSECPYGKKCLNDTSGKHVAMVDAADAIEKLNNKIESLESVHEISPEAEYAIDKHADNLIAHMDELIKDLKNKPRWIPIKEQSPKAYEEVLLHFPHNQAAGFIDRDGCWAVYSGDGFYTEVADNEPKPTHWANKLPVPPKEEV